MATLTTVRLNKCDFPNWGFRLQGGKDFGTPLVIQKVNGGSPAEQAGLIAGDAVIKINNVDVYNLLHKEAQDVIVRSGNSIEMVIQRGGLTWKPSVLPTGSIPKPSPVVNNISPVTKTSLVSNKQENIGAIGTGHNVSAKPFNTQVNGAVNGGSKLVNKQYNTPLKLYSEDAIAETLSAQAEVLSTGALGVNFKKNEKNYDSSNSAVFRMLQEAENDAEHESEPDSGIVTAPNKGMAGLRHVEAPINRPVPATPQLPAGQNICAECERLIVGVFVRIKDKNLHVECFKCATCGSSLKNVGYYNISNKLYCDIHAKAAAIASNNPSAVPVTISPGGKAPVSAISAALSSHPYPSSSPLSPKTSGFTPSYPPSNFSGPKPFSSVSAPLSPGSSLPRAAPLSPQNNFNRAPLSPSAPSYSSYSPSSTAERTTNITWPPIHPDPEVPTACPLFYPPPSKVEAEIEKKHLSKNQSKFESEYFTEESEDVNMDETMSFYSEDLSFSGRKSATECVEMLSETLDTQKLVEDVIKTSPQLVLPPLDNGNETVVNKKVNSSLSSCPIPLPTIDYCQKSNVCDIKRPTQFTPNTVEFELPSKIENSVPQKWESSLTQAVRTVAPDADTFSRIPSRHSASPMASALAIAPAQPFNPQSSCTLEPVSLPEETEPYFPPEHPTVPTQKEEKQIEKKTPILIPKSPFVKALETAPDRPFSPVGGVNVPPPVKKKTKDPLDELITDLPKPSEKLDMRSALTTAPEKSYSPRFFDYVISSLDKQDRPQIQKNIDQTLRRPLKPNELPSSFKTNIKEPEPPSYYGPTLIEEQISTQMQKTTLSSENKQTKIVEKETFQQAEISQPNITAPQELQPSTFAPIFQGFTCSFKNKSEHSQFSVEVCTTPPVPTPPPKPQTPISYIATVEQKPGYITKEQIIHKTMDVQQAYNHQKNTKHEVKLMESLDKSKEIQRQTEETILVKSLPVNTILHKAKSLPSYQQDLQASAESELRIMEKKKNAEERLDQRKKEQLKTEQCSSVIKTGQTVQSTVVEQEIVKNAKNTHQQEFQQTDKRAPPKPERSHITKPIIIMEPKDNYNIAEKPNFQPIYQEKTEGTSSPIPRSMTPSMINKAPPILPYYQDNLIAHFHAPIESNILDPSTPNVSRSPSPLPVKSKQDRAKSPAQGPPPNPLKSSTLLPTPQDSRIQQVKKSLQSILPEYKSNSEISKQTKETDIIKKDTNVQANQVTPYVPLILEQQGSLQADNVRHEKQSKEQHHLQICDIKKHQTQMHQTYSENSKTEISQKFHCEHLAASRESQSQSTEKSFDGLTQVCRKNIVTEEYEQSHKETNIQTEKRSNSISKKHPFNRVNDPTIEPSIMQSIHITNPHHVTPFKKTKETVQTQQNQILSDSTEHTTKMHKEDCLTKACELSDQNKHQPTFDNNSHSEAIVPKPPIRHVFSPGSLGPIKHVDPQGVSLKPNKKLTIPNIPKPDIGAGTGRQSGGITAAPKRGKGLLNAAALPGTRVPLCGHCHGQIRGPFITALGKIWCPQHFICATPSCRRPLQDLGFVEEKGELYCEYCFEQYLAPPCSKCGAKIKGDCLKAIGKNFHPECFNCVYCGKIFGNCPFFLEEGNPYCEADWNELFTTKCYACGFPVEAGDRWVEALSNNYHSQCFNCTMCKKNLEGQSFFAKGGRPFCKNHAR